MSNNSTYMSVAKTYEEDYLTQMNAHRDSNVAHIPKFEDDLYEHYEDEEKSKLLAESIEAMVMASEKRFGDEYFLMITPFQNYLYDKYHVDPIDLEFLGLLYLRVIFRASRGGIKCANNQLKKKLVEFAKGLDDAQLQNFIKIFEEDEDDGKKS